MAINNINPFVKNDLAYARQETERILSQESYHFPLKPDERRSAYLYSALTAIAITAFVMKSVLHSLRIPLTQHLNSSLADGILLSSGALMLVAGGAIHHILWKKDSSFRNFMKRVFVHEVHGLQNEIKVAAQRRGELQDFKFETRFFEMQDRASN